MKARRNGGRPQAEPQTANAFIEESFVPGFIHTIGQENQPGVPPKVHLKLFTGPLGPGLFMFSKLATMEPDVAIAVGEALAEEGRRVKSSVEIPQIQLPENLREAA